MSTPLQLKPMTAGDILDRAIRIYRENFVALVTIVAIVNVPLVLLQALSFLLIFPFGEGFSPTSTLQPTMILVGVGLFVIGIIGAVFAVFELGALTLYVSERFMGRVITVRQAYSNAFKRGLSLVIGALLLFLALFALFMLFFGAIFIPAILAALGGSGRDSATALAGFWVVCTCVLFVPGLLGILYFYTRWTFWTQAIMLESYNSTGGLGRSWKLVKGSFWRVLGFNIALGIMAIALTFGASTTITFGAAFLPIPFGTMLQTVLNGIIQIIIAPLQYATLTVLYYDLRIRKEGFDIQMQLQDKEPPDQNG